MMPRILLVLSLLLWSLPALADPVPSPLLAEGNVVHKKSDDGGGGGGEVSAEEAERLAEEERKKKDKMARVIVLRWSDTDTDYTDENVHRVVRSRIDRSDALFFPEVDLYQNGRKLKDKTVVPAMQPALVPDNNIQPVLDAISQIEAVGYGALQPHEWGLKAQELKQMVELLWFVDRIELREPLFLLYTQIGRAAENQNLPTPPFFEQIGNQPVNYYWYLAACLAQQEPGLMSKVTDQELLATLNYYLQQLQAGAYPTIKVDLELDDNWDGEAFGETYELLFNGLPVQPDENAQVPVFLGRTDIYLKRLDTGHGLSERLEVTKLDDKFYPVMQNARKRMGIDFIDQLFLHPNECSPELDGDILNYLSIYAKLHAKSEIYIAVPQFGNPNKTWIWRYDRKMANLSLVGGAGDDFPVRFALLFSTGVLYDGATVSVDQELSEEDANAGTLDVRSRVSTDMAAAELPLNFELRGHYNRLMVNVGLEASFNLANDDGWEEFYQLGKNNDTGVAVEGNCTYSTVDGNGDGDPDTDSDGNIMVESSCGGEIYNQRTLNRNLYFGSAVVLGRNAGLGFGPRVGFRMGWKNIPHGVQPTLNLGWAMQPPMPEGGERVRPLIDIDLRGGVIVATGRSLAIPVGETYKVYPLFGMTIGAGLTF
jgi:hypothetical protein